MQDTELMTLSRAYNAADPKTKHLIRIMLGITPERTVTMIDLRTAKYFVYQTTNDPVMGIEDFKKLIAICANQDDAKAIIKARKADDAAERDAIIKRGGPALDRLESMPTYDYEIRIQMLKALEF